MSKIIQLEKNTNAIDFIKTLPPKVIVVLRDSWGDVIVEKYAEALLNGKWIDENDVVLWAEEITNWSYDYSIAIQPKGA